MGRGSWLCPRSFRDQIGSIQKTEVWSGAEGEVYISHLNLTHATLALDENLALKCDPIHIHR